MQRTPYFHWSPNTLGYTVLATYVPDSAAATDGLAGGEFRLMAFSDGRLVQPLVKQECGQVTKYAGTYVANRHLRLFRDVLSTSSWPVSLRLSTKGKPSLEVRK